MTTTNPATTLPLRDLGTIQIDSLTVSDLFFNGDHQAFNEYCESAGGKCGEESMRSALIEDAEEWLDMYNDFAENGVTAEMLADDFLRRL